MPRSRQSLKRRQNELRTAMRAAGRDHNEIAAELARQFGHRLRAAYRHAHGWTLREAAAQMNTIAAHHGLDPHARAGVAPSHLSEWEQWPTGGRKPTPYVLNLMALAYNTTIHHLLDFTDHQHLTARDRLVMNRTGAVSSPATAGPTSGRDSTAAANSALPAPAPPMVSTVDDPPAALPAQHRHVLDPDDEDRLHRVLRQTARADERVVESLATILAAQRVTDDIIGSAALVKPAQTQLALVTDVVRGARGPIRNRVLTVAGQWAHFAGWLHANTGLTEPSSRFYDRAGSV